jgi:hypothetical protein
MYLACLIEVHIRGLVGDVTVQFDPRQIGVDWQADAPMVAKVFWPAGRPRLELLPKRGKHAVGKVTLIVGPDTCLWFTDCQGNQAGPGDLLQRLGGRAQVFLA